MGTYRIVDADTHILEPPDIWKNWLPKRYQERAPQLVKDADGGDAWLFAGSSDPDPIGLVATPGKPFDEFRWTGVTYDDARPGCYEGSARLADMDLDGIDKALVFAPQRTIGHFLGDAEDDFVRAGIDAYNSFLTEQFCAPDPSRLIALPQIPSTGVDDAVDALRKAAAAGRRGVVLSNWPTGAETLTEEDDPFWAAAEETGLPVAIHINVISRGARQAARQAAEARAKAGGAGQDLYGDKRAKSNAKAVGSLAGVFSMVPSTVTQLIFTGVPERFPRLQIALIETGIGWLGHFIEQMDDRYWRNRSWGNLPITEPPSFYWHRNLSASFITDRAGIATRHAVGIDNVMWSSDYPHPVSSWPNSRSIVDTMFEGVDPHRRELMVSANAARVWNL